MVQKVHNPLSCDVVQGFKGVTGIDEVDILCQPPDFVIQKHGFPLYVSRCRLHRVQQHLMLLVVA